MRSIWQDVRLGFRMLTRKPMVTLIAVVTLGLGIGATTAVFTYLDQYLFHPYMYKDQDILVRVDGYDKKRGRRTGVLYPPDYLDIEKNQTVFEMIGAFRFRTRRTPSPEGLEEFQVSEVSSGMFPVLGVQPVLGRWFTPEECRRGGDDVALLSYSYWRDRFGFDRDILGKEIQLDGRFHKIIGVMPAGFFQGPRAYLPLVFTDQELSDQARSGQFGRIQSWAKLKPGVSLEQAQANMTAIAASLEQQHPSTNKDRSVEIFRPKDRDRKRFTDRAVYFVLPALFVILIVCANVAHLQLTRVVDRQKEVAVRASMGAGRWRIVRQFLTENVILAVIGGGLGILVAYVGLDAILAIDPDRSYSRLEYIAVDRNALYFAVGLTCLTAILFGLAPAWIGSKVNLSNVLKESSTRTSAATAGKRLRQGLIVSEIALTTMLLVGAGLMLRGLWQAARMKVGFDTNVITAHTKAPAGRAIGSMSGFQNPEEVRSKTVVFMDQALARLRALPGVQSVAGGGLSSILAGFEPTIPIQSVSTARGDEGQTIVAFRIVTPDFFRTFSIPVLRGRVFEERDRAGSAPVAVVSESLARELFPDRNPLGERIGPPLDPGDKEAPEPLQIIGIVGDIRWSPLPSDPDPPELYLSFAQFPSLDVSFALRAEQGADFIVKPARAEIMALNQNDSVTGLVTIDEEFKRIIRRQSLFPAVMIVFASIAVLLAAVGIYGMTSYAVSQRTQELGIRMAMGAQRGDIVGMVIRQGCWVGGLGIVLGALGSWGLIHVLRSELTEAQLRQAGLTSVDLMTCAVVVFFLGLVFITANYLPARRATKVDPMTALRYE